MKPFAHSREAAWRFFHVACLGLSLILTTACAKDVTTASFAKQSLPVAHNKIQDNPAPEPTLTVEKESDDRLIMRSGFGPRKIGNKKSRMHYGIDVSAPTGSNVLAFADGEITRAATTRGYGKHIDIKHADGNVTRYAHMSKTISKIGDTVQKGQIIGLVGRTGRATGPHLHFEILKDGKPVDPMPHLAGLDDVVRYVEPTKKQSVASASRANKPPAQSSHAQAKTQKQQSVALVSGKKDADAAAKNVVGTKPSTRKTLPEDSMTAENSATKVN